MQLIYLITGCIGVYVPARLMYSYFFNLPKLIQPLKNQIIYATQNQIKRPLLRKRNSALQFTVDHCGELQSPIILQNPINQTHSLETEKSCQSSSLFVQAFVYNNQISILNRQDAVQYGNRLNYKHNLKVNFKEIIDCIPALIYHKYPRTFFNFSPQLHKIQINVQKNTKSNDYIVSVTESHTSRSSPPPYKLEVISNKESISPDNKQALIYENPNGLLSFCSLGTIFVIQKEQNSETIECKQIVDLNSNNTYAQSFQKLLKAISREEDRITVSKGMMYAKELADILKNNQVKELILVREDGKICSINEVKIEEEYFVLNNKNKIFTYLSSIQEKADFRELTLLDQCID